MAEESINIDAPEMRADHETVYRLLLQERWSELLDLVHRNRQNVADDPLLRHAVDVFARTFVARLAEADRVSLKADLEKLFLLHAGDFHRLPTEHFERVVAALVELNADRPEAAAGYARHFPDNPRCAAVLEAYDVRHRVDHEMDERIGLHATLPSVGVDHTVSLFKSDREVDFFMAVREVFATYFVYPNVAISTLIDFEGIRNRLSAEERQYFFRGVVDCVVFDQHGAYRPLYFFEIDSGLHDDERRREKDAMKDRILSAAGQRLHRVRPRDRSTGRTEYVRLLREILRQD